MVVEQRKPRHGTIPCLLDLATLARTLRKHERTYVEKLLLSGMLDR
jgi:hypothetical protein